MISKSNYLLQLDHKGILITNFYCLFLYFFVYISLSISLFDLLRSSIIVFCLCVSALLGRCHKKALHIFPICCFGFFGFVLNARLHLLLEHFLYTFIFSFTAMRQLTCTRDVCVCVCLVCLFFFFCVIMSVVSFG